MTFVKALLFPLAVCAALLLSEYEVWCLDDCGIDASDAASFSPPVSSSDESAVAVDALACLLSPVITPGDDDDSDDE